MINLTLENKRLITMRNKKDTIGYIIDKLAYFESKLNNIDEDLAVKIGLDESIDNLNKVYIKIGEPKQWEKQYIKTDLFG